MSRLEVKIMKTVEQQIILRSDQHYGKKVPPGPLGRVLGEIPKAVRQSVRMAFDGRSTLSGKRPGWLETASDIRFIDYSGDDETILHFELPLLGEAAPELYEQGELWPTKPSPKDTCFDLLADIVVDVAKNNPDSDKFDRPMLNRLTKFNGSINAAFREVAITGQRYTVSHPGILNREVIDTARTFSSNTPDSQQARVVGCLDMIRASTQSFALMLDDDEEVRGVLVNGDIVHFTALFKKRVMVLGKAVFRASGRLLRIDAEEIALAQDDDTFFSSVPKPTRQKLDVHQIVRDQQHKKGLAAIFGKWPGDETDEQIEQALQEMS